MLKNCPQFVPQEVCLACDGCCRFKDAESLWRPKLTQEEKRIGLAQKIFSLDAVDAKGYLKTVNESGICRCQFFNLKENTCGIYPYRPFECQLYPFILHKMDGKVVVSVHLNCPFVQEMRRTEKFQSFSNDLQKFFQDGETRVFLKGNLSYVGQYEPYKDELEYLFTVFEK